MEIITSLDQIKDEDILHVEEDPEGRRKAMIEWEMWRKDFFDSLYGPHITLTVHQIYPPETPDEKVGNEIVVVENRRHHDIPNSYYFRDVKITRLDKEERKGWKYRKEVRLCVV